MKKILLINPPRNLRNPQKQFISPHLGLAYIASFLRQHNYEVKIIDAVIEDFENVEEVERGLYKCGLSWEDLRKRIEEHNPDIVGISCIFIPRFGNVVKISQIVKEINKEIKVVVGGMHVSCCPEDVLSCDSIDFVVIGEGELTFLMLIKALESNKGDLSAIDGIAFKSSKGEIVINPRQDLIEDLDSLPFPAWDLLAIEKYFSIGRDALAKEKRHLSFITSRGCPYSCTFCSSAGFWMRKWRKRSAENVLNELEYLVKEYGIKEVCFEDDNLSLDPKRLEEICLGIIERNLNIRWNTPNGISVKMLTPQLIKLMKKSGCKRLNFGIESGDEHILHDVIKKDFALEKFKEIVASCRKEGIITSGYFVIGMPGETKESIERSLEFAKSLDLNEIAVFIATPFPGTELYNICKEKRYLKYEYNEITAEDEIESRIFFETPLISGEDLRKAQSRFYSEFYKSQALKRPFYYLKRTFKNPGLILRYVKEALNK